MKTNNYMVAYVHDLDSKHECGPMHTMAKLVKSYEKSKILNCWENFCIQSHHQQGLYLNRLHMIKTPYSL